MRKNQILKFLGEGHKVKAMIFHRGREMAHQEVGRAKMQRLLQEIADQALVELGPRMEANVLMALLAPKRGGDLSPVRREPFAVTSVAQELASLLANIYLHCVFELWTHLAYLAIRAALEKLSPRQREVIELAYFEGLTQTEMAERLGQPLGTVKSWVRRSLLALRRCLEP